MSQIDFFFCREDKMQLADLIFKSGAKMIIEGNYDSPNFTTVSTLYEYEEYTMDNILMLIIHSETLKHPLEWATFKKEEKEKFFLRQKYGGPTIDFYSPGMVEKKDKKIGPGFLASHFFYYHGKDKFYPNEFYKNLFKTFSSHIKKNCKPAKLKNRTFWVGINAIRVCKDEGYSLVEIGGQNILDLV